MPSSFFDPDYQKDGEVGDTEEVETRFIHVKDMLTIGVVQREVFLGQFLENRDRTGFMSFKQRLLDKSGTQVKIAPFRQLNQPIICLDLPEFRLLKLSNTVKVDISKWLRKALDHEIVLGSHNSLVMQPHRCHMHIR